MISPAFRRQSIDVAVAIESNKRSAVVYGWRPQDFGHHAIDAEFVRYIAEFQINSFIVSTGVVDPQTVMAVHDRRAGARDSKTNISYERRKTKGAPLGVRPEHAGTLPITRADTLVGRHLVVLQSEGSGAPSLDTILYRWRPDLVGVETRIPDACALLERLTDHGVRVMPVVRVGAGHEVGGLETLAKLPIHALCMYSAGARASPGVIQSEHASWRRLWEHVPFFFASNGLPGSNGHGYDRNELQGLFDGAIPLVGPVNTALRRRTPARLSAALEPRLGHAVAHIRTRCDLLTPCVSPALIEAPQWPSWQLLARLRSHCTERLYRGVGVWLTPDRLLDEHLSTVFGEWTVEQSSKVPRVDGLQPDEFVRFFGISPKSARLVV